MVSSIRHRQVHLAAAILGGGRISAILDWTRDLERNPVSLAHRHGPAGVVVVIVIASSVGGQSLVSVQAQLERLLAALAVDDFVGHGAVCSDLAGGYRVGRVGEDEALIYVSTLLFGGTLAIHTAIKLTIPMVMDRMPADATILHIESPRCFSLKSSLLRLPSTATPSTIMTKANGPKPAVWPNWGQYRLKKFPRIGNSEMIRKTAS
jgi:hypothetical protein